MIHYLALNYNSTSHTIGFVNSLPSGSKATILENSDNSDFFELLRRHYSPDLIASEPSKFSARLNNQTLVTIIDSPKNIGFAAGMNFLTTFLDQDDLAVVINNDVKISLNSSSAIEAMHKTNVDEFWSNSIISPRIETNSDIWYNGGRLSLLKLGGVHFKKEIANESFLDTSGFTLRQTGYVTGCCLIFRKDLIESLGGQLFNECFFFSGEDVELNIRCVKREIQRYICPSIVIVTETSASSGGSKSTVGISYESYYRTGLLRFVPRHMVACSATFIILNRLAKAILELMQGNFKLSKSYILPLIFALVDLVIGKYGRFRIK